MDIAFIASYSVRSGLSSNYSHDNVTRHMCMLLRTRVGLELVASKQPHKLAVECGAHSGSSQLSFAKRCRFNIALNYCSNSSSLNLSPVTQSVTLSIS